MLKRWMFIDLIVMVCLLAAWPTRANGQAGFESVTADAFNRAVPTDFYLEGNHIPVQKRNAVVLQNAKGAHLVLALLDTTGYSSQVQQKYTGMLITETRVSICGNALGVGSYGFGLDHPATSGADARFHIYNQAGEKVGECTAKKDDSVKQPKPLFVLAPAQTPKYNVEKFYLGKYAIEIR